MFFELLVRFVHPLINWSNTLELERMKWHIFDTVWVCGRGSAGGSFRGVVCHDMMTPRH